jgi:signal transduction histidine kinase
MEHTSQTRPGLARAPRSEVGEPNNLHAAFIRNVSHELRTPLTIINGYTTLLQDGSLGPLAPEQRRAVGAIASRAHEMRAMVEKIGVLMAAEARAGISVRFALNGVVAEVVRERLRHALDCLVENAVKFTPAGGRIEVQVGTEADWAYVAVSDTGIGIPAAELERIFAGFYQVDSSTTRRTGGIGLGLTIAKTVSEAHGGHIEVQSEPGQGSRFTVWLPIPSPGDQTSQVIEGEMMLRRILGLGEDERASTDHLLDGMGEPVRPAEVRDIVLQALGYVE